MVILDIQPIHNKFYDYNCFEDQVASVARWLGCGHVLSYIRFLEFNFEKPTNSDKESCLGNWINIKSNFYFEDLEKYHGLKLYNHSNLKSSICLKIIKESLEKSFPVIIWIDVFFCSWHKAYKKEHDIHCCLVVGYDVNCSKLFCIDGYENINVNQGVLNIEDFLQGCSACTTFKLVYNNISKFNYYKEIYFVILKIEQADSFNAMRKFSEKMRNSLNISLELGGYENDFWKSSLFSNIRLLKKQRLAFSGVLEDLMQKYNIEEFKELQQKSIELAQNWDIVYLLLVKLKYIPNNNKLLDNICNNINKIAVEEEKFFMLLRELVLSLYKDNYYKHHFKK